jgi:hypothetical protein
MTYIFFSHRALQMQARIPAIVTSVNEQADGIHEMTVTINEPYDLLAFMHAAIELGMDIILNDKNQKDEANH